MKQHLVFMGFKHCGKSTLGRHAATQLKRPFYDLDDILTETYGDKDITPREIYRDKGADYFYELELQAVNKLLDVTTVEEPSIISLGGGTIDNKKGLEHIMEYGSLIYLEERPDVLYERIIRSGIPAFFEEDKDTYEQFLGLYKKRSVDYEQYANNKISIDGRELSEAQKFLMQQLKLKAYVG